MRHHKPYAHCHAFLPRRLVLHMGLAGLTGVASLAVARPGAAAQAQDRQATKEAIEHLVVIAHHEFEPWGFTPHAGDSLRFSNRSDIAHNLYLTYADGEIVTLDTQAPGTDRVVRIARPGRLIVKCWIHPVIRMELQVGPPR